MNGEKTHSLLTLPGDDVRQLMWRYSDRYDLQMVVQSARSVARGLVARLVADGERNTHEWTPGKNSMLKAMDDAGITSAFMDAEHGGYVDGPKNLVLAMIAFELAWVDAGAATGSLAGNLGLAPIHERGTEEQKAYYMGKSVPQPGVEPWRAAFALTEPLPYVGVDTNVLNGKVKIVEWKDGEEPILHVDKRGRFITGMGFANFVSCAVTSDDPRIRGTLFVVVEETDPGIFDRGTATKKMVHQLSSTSDPVFSLTVPASRIIGGYTVQDGVIVPNFNHGEVIEAVFRRTRVTVGLMTSAKLLSSIEPIIRYQRTRFRGGDSSTPGSPKYEQGIQQREDALHRLIDIWTIGEAGASLGFATARLFDAFDPIERQKDAYFAEQGLKGPRAQMKAFRAIEKDCLEFIRLDAMPDDKRDQARYDELKNDTLVQFAVTESLAQVFCPATKLWNTGYGSTMMREAVSLMGGYGVTEDCPGFLFNKWQDTQLEATYEGPEAVQRRQITVTMTNELFLAQYKLWMGDMRRIASERPGTGACAIASAMDLWLYTLNHLQQAKDADGQSLFHGSRHGVVFWLADILCWILAARCFVLDTIELETKGAENPSMAEGLPGTVQFMTDLCHVMAAKTAGEVGRVCAELVNGYNRHPAWDDKDCCFACDDVQSLEGIMPGIEGEALARGEVTAVEKAGPCVRFKGLETFQRLRMKLDSCITGTRLAKDRAAESLTTVMIPEALDYPL